MKKGMIVIIAILVIVATLFSACTMNKDIEVNTNTESDREEVPLETEEVMQPVVEDGVALWRFTPSGKTPVLTIGAVSRIMSTDTWQEAWEALTEYTQKTWGLLCGTNYLPAHRKRQLRTGKESGAELFVRRHRYFYRFAFAA